MKIERHLVPRMTIGEFARANDLTMVVRERNPRDMEDFRCTYRFYARFKDSDLKEGPILSGEYGNGHSEEEAIRNYAALISGRLLVINAYSHAGASRREIRVPILIRK